MRLISLIALFLIIPLASQAIPYWPAFPGGGIYHYESNDGLDWDIRYSWNGDIQQRKYVCDSGCIGGEYYTIVDGVVGLIHYTSYYPTLLSPVEGSYDPPLPIAWEGMKDGDSKIWGEAPNNIFVTVVGEQIETPLGLLDVLRVRFIPMSFFVLPIGDFYLHSEYGPVKEGFRVLVGWDIPVAIENRSWSSVKAMYR